MDFGFENLVADWNGVDRPTVSELSEEKVHTRGQKKKDAGTAGRTVEEEEKKPAVGLTSPNQRYSRSSPFYTITCEQPIPHVRDLRPLSSRVHPDLFYSSRRFYIDCTAAAFLSTKLFILSGPRYDDILVDKLTPPPTNSLSMAQGPNPLETLQNCATFPQHGIAPRTPE